jgi:hypothetical protein
MSTGPRGILQGAAFSCWIDAGMRHRAGQTSREDRPVTRAHRGDRCAGSTSTTRVVSWKHFLDGIINRTYDLNEARSAEAPP